MALTVFINDVEIPTSGETHIERGSISIDKRIEERSVASFVVVDELGDKSYVRGYPVDIVRPWLPPFFEVLFSGFIDTPGEARLAPGSSGLLHDITCFDNHYLADKRLVIKSYTTQTLAYIVNDIFTDYLSPEGITVGEVQAGPTIKSAIFNYVKVSEAFDALKDLSGFTWFIDEFERLFFINRATHTAPWNLDSVTYRAIKGSTHLSGGNPLYRNRQYVMGGKGLTTVQAETFTGDGTTEAFTVGYPIALKPVITVGGAPVAPALIGIKGIDTGMTCYWSKGDATVTFAAAPAAVAIVITFYGQYPLIARADSPTDITARAAIEGGTGIVEEVATEAQHETTDAMREAARTKLVEYCQEAEKFVYQTEDRSLFPGQIQEITSAPFGFAAHEMLIESVAITAQGDLILYNISCLTGPVMGSWAKFFSHILTRQDKAIKIGDSLLLILLQQAEALALSETTDETEHITEDYDWDDADMRWDFFTWG